MASSTSLDELQRKFDGNKRRYLAPLANEYRKTGDLDRAIELCARWLPEEEIGKHLSGYVVYGQALYEAGRLDEAASAFGTALELDPENLIALRHMGDIAREQGDHGAARDWYLRVLDADPRNEEIAAALQSLDGAPPAGARNTPRSTTPAIGAPSLGSDASRAGGSGTPTPSRLDALSGFTAPSFVPATGVPSLEAPSLGFGLVEPRVESPTERTDPSALALDSAAGARSAHGDDASAVDFDPGFFGATGSVDSADVAPAASAVDDPGAVSAAPDLALDDPTVHDVDPSELAFAAALDAPIVDDPAPTEYDASFDFQATSLDDDAPSTDGGASSGSPLGLVQDSYGAVSLGGAADAAASAAPTYGGGFDANEFFTDDAEVPPPAVTPPADLGYESMEFVPPARDADAGTSAPVDAPFVTETMAELYLQQGFRTEALDVYEQLLAASPNDANLRDRVEQLRSGAPSSLGMTGEYRAIDAHPESSAPAASNGAAPTARDFFSALARRGVGGHDPSPNGDGSHDAGADVVTEHASADQDEAPQAHAASEGGDALAALFASPTSNADDEQAASTLAALVGDGSMHGDAPSFAAGIMDGGSTGAPTAARTATPLGQPAVTTAESSSAPSRPAARELSLDDVFGAPRPAPRSTPNSSFSFDQFFAEAQTPTAPREEPAAPAPQPAPSAPADEASDLAQFNAWLEGLKKR